MRALLTIVVPLLLPTLLYGGWLALTRRRPPEWREAPWLGALVAGVALLLATLAVWGLGDRDVPGGHYVPPRLQGGEIVPGHVVRP